MIDRPMTNEELTTATRALIARVEKLEEHLLMTSEQLLETSRVTGEGFKTLAEHLIGPTILRKLKVKLVKDEPATGDGEAAL